MDAQRQTRDELWVQRAVSGCVEVARRLGPSYAKRLASQHLPFDPLDDLLTLAARRAVSLERPARRRLPRAGASIEARAFAALDVADRRVLRDAFGDRCGAGHREPVGTGGTGDAGAACQVAGGADAIGADAGGGAQSSPDQGDVARLEHAAAALARLARNVRSARRRGGDTPIGDP